MKFEIGRRLFENFGKFEERSSKFLEIGKFEKFQMNDACHYWLFTIKDRCGVKSAFFNKRTIRSRLFFWTFFCNDLQLRVGENFRKIS